MSSAKIQEMRGKEAAKAWKQAASEVDNLWTAVIFAQEKPAKSEYLVSWNGKKLIMMSVFFDEDGTLQLEAILVNSWILKNQCSPEETDMKPQKITNCLVKAWKHTSFLVGGNSNIVYFHPITWGFMIQFWRSYFSDGLVQPPTIWVFS